MTAFSRACYIRSRAFTIEDYSAMTNRAKGVIHFGVMLALVTVRRTSLSWTLGLTLA